MRPCMAISKPACSRIFARCSCAGRSLPGGFTVSKRISSWSRGVASTALDSRCWDAAGRMSETLFDPGEGEPPRTRTGVPTESAPLAVRLRPRTLGELVGQQHLLHEGSALRRALEEGGAHSMVLYGPPGTGKTTIARLVAGAAQAAFEELSAVEAGRVDGSQVVGGAPEPPRS